MNQSKIIDGDEPMKDATKITKALEDAKEFLEFLRTHQSMINPEWIPQTEQTVRILEWVLHE